jgi:hypothetical protein
MGKTESPVWGGPEIAWLEWRALTLGWMGLPVAGVVVCAEMQKCVWRNGIASDCHGVCWRAGEVRLELWFGLAAALELVRL